MSKINELPRGKPRGISPFPALKNIFWKREMGCRWIGNFITAFALIPLFESLKQYCTAASRGVLNQILTNKEEWDRVHVIKDVDIDCSDIPEMNEYSGLVSRSPRGSILHES